MSVLPSDCPGKPPFLTPETSVSVGLRATTLVTGGKRSFVARASQLRKDVESRYSSDLEAEYCPNALQIAFELQQLFERWSVA